MQQAAGPPPAREPGDAPPKQVAQALEQLGQAGRLIADVRLGADRMLEALFFVAEEPHHQHSAKCLNLVLKEESLMRQHLQNLRVIGKQLEESGVLNDSLRSRSNSWGLHMPLVCPDGAVVAYAWKRQLAGQAGASAVDRTRLALKAFRDQKRRFFPHLTDDSAVESANKKHRSPWPISQELGDLKTLADILSNLEKEVPNLQAFTYPRLEWLKRASSLPSTANDNSSDLSKDHSFSSASKWKQDSISMQTTDKAAVIELLSPSVFRAVVSLHTAGSMDPDAVAFFSPDEGGSHLHAWGFSSHHVFKHVSEHASMALQYFTWAKPETALHLLMHWICSYQTLFIKVCSKCGKLLSMDKQSGLILPPVKRQFRHFSVGKTSTRSENSISDHVQAFHIGCFSDEA
ncbi:mediator of RNA polymerase II transcription subunit 27 [Andrographis paniculata]|uniref:mediator of RNA polymerase II transcription subunit 27 n=1 Tax=Andrographis paniculata TaxID=175694 RepID=UPI0021E95867|nr:mediator of RNA polymerase II transcription subunit 27 [Andrographis paniculata]XP_051144971.1 mediator of RNA polymerase II transcription subunit 27 [Andrographis paniculata]XP_051144972.1 mediator of RNA polymerase II transcription subunit 27 [Andrographis paniculata]